MKHNPKLAAFVAYFVSTMLGAGAFAAPMPVQSATKDAKGVVFKLQGGSLRIEVCDDRTVHVVCSPTEAGPAQKIDFVVNKQWSPATFDLKEEAGRYVVSTAKVKVGVDRASGAVSFLDADGKTVLQEPASGGKSLASEQKKAIEQTFVSPADERLYGMSQSQEGIWNWRGMPIELRQVNTQAALPVLVSTKGYGIFWNNASLTDFNPVDNEIKLTTSTEAATGGPTATEQLGRGGGRGARGPRPSRTGTFTTTAAGEYVFFVKDGDRRSDIGIEIDGKTAVRIQNQWLPYSVATKVTLPANATCSVKLLGGGNNAKLFARPLGDTTVFRSSYGDSIDYYYFQGPELDDVINEYRVATGAAPLWPKWAYGFWQCRERYSSSKQILDTVAEFRKRNIPMDLIVQDWQYWGNLGWGAYEWDKNAYPDPQKLIDGIHEQNAKFMISVWSNPQGKAGNDIKAKGFKIAGTDWVDALNPAARDLRWDYLNDAFFKPGTDSWWQDATEPGDEGEGMVNKKTFMGDGNFYRNAYPLFANQTVYEGQRKTTSDKRVVILTRSSFPGQQRYASALWSGDINGDWITLKRQIPAGLNVCLTGLPYWTTDCGGFFRPGAGQYQSDDFAELLTRWFQYSTFCPVQRMHGYQTETEFWKYPKAVETLVEYDKLRYRLMPYIYSLGWKVTSENYTMMRALPMDFRGDVKTHDIGDEYMFGPAFLVSPVTEAKATSRKVYLPAGASWVNFWTGEYTAGGQEIEAMAPVQMMPLFIRAGSIVPFGPEIQYATEKPADPIQIRVYRGADGAFTLYEDESDNYNYEKGVYSTIPIQWKESSKTLTIGERKGEFPGMLKNRTFKVVFVRGDKGLGMMPDETVDVEVKYDGKAVEVKPPAGV